MNAMPIVVTQHHLNLTGQNVLTFVSWALTIILLAVTHVSQVAVYLCTVLSIVFAVTLVRFAAAFVPGSEPVAAAGPGAPPERYQAGSTPRTRSHAIPPDRHARPGRNQRAPAPAGPRRGMGDPRGGGVQ
jgi:hypothetical protein